MNRVPLPPSTDEPASDAAPDRVADAGPGPGPPARSGGDGLDGRLFRWVFYFVWIFALPFALAVLSVWLLTPSPQGGPPSALRVFVGEQQIPAGIVLYTIFAMAI